MRTLVVLTFVVASCSGTSSADPPRAWRAMAARAHGDRTAAADAALGRLDSARREEVERVLDRMAGFGLGAEALRRAGALAESSAGIAADPEWAGSGTAPGTAALYEGALAVLAGMATASARAAPASAPALVQTICSMPMPQYFNSGGRAPDVVHRHALCDAVDAIAPSTPSTARTARCAATWE